MQRESDRIQQFTAAVQRIWPGSTIVLRPNVGANKDATTESETDGMQKFQMKDGEGSLFKNEKKSKDTDAEYNGSVRVNGIDFTINAWKKQAKSGLSYLKMSVRPKSETNKRSAEFNDEISF
jgi:hypothetical protein